MDIVHRDDLHRGGPAGQADTFAAQTVMEVARLHKGDRIALDSTYIAYITAGSGQANGHQVVEGHLLSGDSLELAAEEDSLVILVHELQNTG